MKGYTTVLVPVCTTAAQASMSRWSGQYSQAIVQAEQPESLKMNPLIYPMAVHVALTAFLYTLLTIVRAPSIWGLGRRPDGTNPWANVEPRISANLSNQFEWPLFFYVACLVLLERQMAEPLQLWLAWLFVAGRFAHSYVQVMTKNVRLRGLVFTINFLAVLGMWAGLLLAESGMSS